MTGSHVLLGIGFKIASTFLFTIMLTLGKAFSMYPVAQIVFFRSAFALIPLMIWLLLRGDFPRALRTNRFGGHLLRSIAGIGSMFCIFGAYALLPLADATAIGYASPLMIVVLASIFLGERAPPLRWAAVCVGFLGVLVMLWEHLGQGGAPGSASHPRSATGAILMLMAAFLIAIAMIQTRGSPRPRIRARSRSTSSRRRRWRVSSCFWRPPSGPSARPARRRCNRRFG